MCPYAIMRMSVCYYAYILMLPCVCPHVIMCVSSYCHDCVLIPKQVNHVVKVFNEYVPPEELLHVDRCQHLERAIETVNREIPAENLLFLGMCVSLCVHKCVLIFGGPYYVIMRVSLLCTYS